MHPNSTRFASKHLHTESALSVMNNMLLWSGLQYQGETNTSLVIGDLHRAPFALPSAPQQHTIQVVYELVVMDAAFNNGPSYLDSAHSTVAYDAVRTTREACENGNARCYSAVIVASDMQCLACKMLQCVHFAC